MDMEKVRQAARAIKAGGLVIYPTDTVYILAVEATNQSAVDKLIAFKNRWTGKAISVAVTDEKMASEYVELDENARQIYKNLLPGPFTIVSGGKHKVARGIEAENGTLGIRIPDNEYVCELVKLVKKPITATSANLSGRSPHYSVQSLMRTLSKKKMEMIDLVVDVGKLPKNKPSTVIDITEPEIKVLRRGDLITGSSQTLISKSEKETEKIARFILNKSLSSRSGGTLLPLTRERKPLVLGLSGDLGCGKTVFSRAVGRALGVTEKITSPTFVIWNEYKTLTPIPFPLTGQGEKNFKTSRFLHFDLYRLGERFEFEEIKFLEQFTPEVIACIEWPENMGGEYLEKLKEKTNYIPINFKYLDERTREIEF